MIPYNVEIFTPAFEYRSSAQVEYLKHKFDYLDIEKSGIDLPGILEAERGDWIRITRGEFSAEGIVSEVIGKENSVELEYKPFHKILDIDVYMNPEALTIRTMEQWLADLIRDTYVINEDKLQNISGLEVKVTSGHYGAALADYEEGIHNLFDVSVSAFLSYGIVCEFEMNIQRKKLTLTIGSREMQKRTIEADLPNVLKKTVLVKEASETTNKLVVYNQEDYTQKIIYYRDRSDRITTLDTNRMVPVVCESVAVKVGNKTLEEVALSRAENKLKPSRYDNLIELKVQVDDELIQPEKLKIGQQVNVIHNGKNYHTVYTGMEYEKELITLIFGAVRLELTKTLKRRFRSWQ